MALEKDPIRDAAWWMRAYYFLAKFKNYELKSDLFLEGMFNHFCLWDKKKKEWLGPEIVRYAVEDEWTISDRRLIK